MFGAIDFYLKAKKKGIVPIIGQEFYMAPGSRFKKESVKGTGEENAHHLILLAKNEIGYKNLIKLSSIGYTEGFYYKPRIDLEVLEKHSEGLICSTACIAGQVPRALIKGNYNEAKEIAGRFSEIFGKDNFYLELQYHGIKEQEIANRELIKLSSELNLPLIATNDAHYLKKEDAYSHEVLLCIQTGKTMKDETRMKFGGSEFYFKTPDEMAALFSDYPDALYNTYSIFQMIDLELSLGNPILPNFEVLDSYLDHLVTEGALKRFGGIISDEVRKRIDYELSVIKGMHFSGYFLIVWDFIKHAKSVGIPVGPGRGSAAGSIVSYSLGITALNPLKYNLLFERFLNPERNEMPDMDIDFCAERREEIIKYIKEKYGEDKVSQIITFNKMKSKLVIKDVARTLDIPFDRANEISNMIEEKTLDEVLKKSKEFKDSYNKGIIPRELVDISLKLEGLVRSAGKHAAGIVISKGPLTDYVPLYKDPKDGGISSQYEKDTLEKTGLVKMDLLGLKNLTIIDKCLKKIKASTGVDLNL
jgi:DNA polymerase-3 subunit alpha